jgi:hypothetical protein
MSGDVTLTDRLKPVGALSVGVRLLLLEARGLGVAVDLDLQLRRLLRLLGRAKLEVA